MKRKMNPASVIAIVATVSIMALGSCVTAGQKAAQPHMTEASTIVSQRCVVPRLWGNKPLPTSDHDARFALNPCDPNTRVEDLAQLTRSEMAEAGTCLTEEMNERWGSSGHPLVEQYSQWQTYGDSVFGGVAQGGCYMQIFVNPTGAAYGKYEKSGPLPDGTRVVKATFAGSRDGKLLMGPFIAMEKIVDAADTAASGGWRFTHILADGTIKDTQTPAGRQYVEKCVACHRKAIAGDFIFYPPERVRRSFQ